MSRLTNADQIWQIQPTRADKEKGARYAAVSLSWTYDRMEQEEDREESTRNRAFNIAKGLVGQVCLQRKLDHQGVDLEIQEKSHRETDSYDLRFPSNSEFADLDIKTFNHFTDYGIKEKPSISKELLGENIDYEGPEWSHFFPMLIPCDQYYQNKEAYCFGVSSSIDYRNKIEGRDGYELFAFPDPETSIGDFLISDVKSREQRNQTFSISVSTGNSLSDSQLQLKVVGEADGGIKEIWTNVGQKPTEVGAFSGVNSFKITEDTYRAISNQNTHFDVSVSSSTIGNIPENNKFRLRKSNFHNLLMPSDFKFYFFGWITKREFKRRAINRPGWCGPSEAQFLINRFWADPSPRDKRFLRGNDLDWTITEGGVMRGAVRQNAGCYYYPKISRRKIERGGLRRSNLYVLPEDQRPMDEL